MPDPNNSRHLLRRLLDYIGEQAKVIDPRAYRLRGSEGTTLQRTDIAGLPGVEFDIKVAGDHIWLRVPRLAASKPLPPLEKYRPFFRVSNAPDGALPSIDEAHFLHWLGKASEGKTSDERTDLESRARSTLRAALEEYVALWKSWAEGERPRRRTISLYGDFFALKQQIEGEETAKPQELVWGVGITSWLLGPEDGSFEFEYPLLTQAIEIAIDESTLAIELRPRTTDTRLEFDAFIACQMTGAADVEKSAREHLVRTKERPVTPFDPSTFSDVLKLAARSLDPGGSYREILVEGSAVPAPGEHIVVTDAWVILSRPRANNLLLDDLKRLQEKLASGCNIPLGPEALVTPPSDRVVEFEAVRFRGLSGRGRSDGGGTPEELFFPLPYNDEQVTIVQRLERAAGVCVQGPPGTGKTHTIANIVCHYLATGRRVLVTSRGEHALEVLQDKIPEGVRALTVALLAGDREGIRQFQASIEAIQHQVSQLNPELTRQEINTLQSTIDRAHAELGAIDKRVDEIAIAQLSDVEIDGNPMRAQKLAELVVSGREQFGWFDDVVSLTDEHAPPLNEEEGGQLREARRKLGADLVYAAVRIPVPDSLPPAADIAKLHELLVKIRTIDAEVARGELLPLRAVTPELLAVAREILARLDEAIALAEELEQFEGGWPLELRLKCSLPSFVSERAALESLFAELDALITARAEFLRRPVVFPAAGLASPRVHQAVARGAATGKPFGLMAMGAGDARADLGTVRIAGLPPASAEDWAHVQKFLQLHNLVLTFVTRWNFICGDLSIPELNGGVVELRRIEIIANAARKAHRLATKYDAVLPRRGEAVFEQSPVKQLLGKASDLRTVREQLVRHLTKSELSGAAIQLSTLKERLAGTSGPISNALRAFVDVELGNPKRAVERVASHYGELVAELRRVAALSNDLALINEFSNLLAAAGAAKLATRVRSEPIAASGDDRAFPPAWRQAWNWARIRSFLDGIESREELRALSARRIDLERGLARLYEEMVSKAAWLATKRSATPKVLQALSGYAIAIRRIGQGTGPNATRYKRDARESMLDAAGAVPCWIMDHRHISEAMPADIGAFDLVIVDEASQSDLWALPAILRGKKILVVGDDKQVSPDAGFIHHQAIQDLLNRFLSEQPYGREMTPEKSLYDLAARVFAGNQVMLREHFRCAPPIIAYSNRSFYEGGIQPLRIPTASERIDPPLVDIYVPSGFRDRRDRNDGEAFAIAAEIDAILKDERLAGRSIGVVSLLGMDQAKHIDSIVRQNCDAAELRRRRFLCGEPRKFQGSERDIMFLSLVVDSENCRALSGMSVDQRFNVAGSRARDRMYLVRSVTTSDLSHLDIRLPLLNHFDKPMIVDEEEAENYLDRCESGFEQDVFKSLIAAGYRVTPQVKTGAYRLDMVVEGSGDTRLAIECDGDEFHGPDRWQHDMSRQRTLERAGWIFWRCFASTWSLRKEEIFSELTARLTAMGIAPMGSVDRAPTLVEKRTWMPPATTAEDELGQDELAL